MIDVNLEIPGYIKSHDLRYLGAIVRDLPQDSVIVDVGCGWGREAWVFSKNAPSGAQIYCTDIWGWKPTWRYVFKGDESMENSLERSLENSQQEFLHYMKGCLNIHTHQAEKDKEWESPMADFIFYDEEDEVEDAIIPKLRHWHSRLKPGGILAGTDFYPYSSPAVKVGLVKAVQKCVREFNMVLIHNTQTSIWMMVSPETFVSWRRKG